MVSTDISTDASAAASHGTIEETLENQTRNDNFEGNNTFDSEQQQNSSESLEEPLLSRSQSSRHSVTQANLDNSATGNSGNGDENENIDDGDDDNDDGSNHDLSNASRMLESITATVAKARSVMRNLPPVRGRHGTKKFIGGIVIFLATILTTEEIIEDLPSSHHGHYQPISRKDSALSCATHLSSSLAGTTDPFRNNDSSQMKAVEWFVSGAGQNISLDNCSTSSSSTFNFIYSLLVLREELQLDIPSWHDEAKDVLSISDVCQHWHRVGCNDRNTYITSLHLSNLDKGLSGTLPAEIAGLAHMERLELYDNKSLGGNLPQSIGRMMTNLQYLYIHHTSIHGHLPSSFSNLKELRELFIEDTEIEGKIPSGVCDLRQDGTLNLFYADCAPGDPFVQCPWPACCSNCYNHEE